MTSLFMGQLIATGVPADEAVVRSNTTPVDINAAPAMQDDMPEQGEVDTDPNPTLGMVNRQKASKWIPRFRTRPAWVEEVDNSTQHNLIIDRQVSSSGHAASKEAGGEWGHGTMPAAIGIEPVSDLTQGGKMGNEYFTTNKREIQDTMGNVMTTTPGDSVLMTEVAATGKVGARKAAMSAAYNEFWNGGN